MFGKIMQWRAGAVGAFIFAIVTWGAGRAGAETIHVTFQSVNYASIVNITLTPTLGDPSTATSVSGLVGLYHWSQSGPVGDGLPHEFDTFCIELLQDISTGTSYDYSLAPLADADAAPHPGIGLLNPGKMTALQADQLSLLWAQYDGDIHTANGAATLQFAIWDVLYGADHLTITSHSAGDIGLAAAWATPTSTLGGRLNMFGPRQNNLFTLSSPGDQDQITPGVVAPLPSTAGAGCVLLVALGCLQVARRKLPNLQ